MYIMKNANQNFANCINVIWNKRSSLLYKWNTGSSYSQAQIYVTDQKACSKGWRMLLLVLLQWWWSLYALVSIIKDIWLDLTWVIHWSNKKLNSDSVGVFRDRNISNTRTRLIGSLPVPNSVKSGHLVAHLKYIFLDSQYWEVCSHLCDADRKKCRRCLTRTEIRHWSPPRGERVILPLIFIKWTSCLRTGCCYCLLPASLWLMGTYLSHSSQITHPINKGQYIGYLNVLFFCECYGCCAIPEFNLTDNNNNNIVYINL